ITSLGHVLCRWMRHELERRQRVDPPRAPWSEGGAPREPADERETDWDDRIARCLSDVIRDDNLARELRNLKLKEQRILNLRFFHQMSYISIARKLSGSAENVRKEGR